MKSSGREPLSKPFLGFPESPQDDHVLACRLLLQDILLGHAALQHTPLPKKGRQTLALRPGRPHVYVSLESPKALCDLGPSGSQPYLHFQTNWETFGKNVAAEVSFHVDEITISRGRAQVWAFFKSPQLPPSGPRLRTKSALLDGSGGEGLSLREPSPTSKGTLL